MRSVSVALVCIVVAALACAGPDHDAAMALYQSGVIQMEGDLGPAIATFEQVCADYPAETEAVAWARTRLAEIYFAGYRLDDGAASAGWVWERIQEGQLHDPHLVFWCGYHYARCLDRLGHHTLVRQVCRAALDAYESLLPAPGVGATPAAGWMHYFLANASFWGPEKDYAEAAAQAEQAAQLGEALGNPELAGWATLLRCQASLERGDLFSAVLTGRTCVERFTGAVSTDYDRMARTFLVQAYAKNGMVADASAALQPLLQDAGLDPSLKARALNAYAEAAEIGGATPEAIRAWRTLLRDCAMTEYWPGVATRRLVPYTDAGVTLTEPSLPMMHPEERRRLAAMAAIRAATTEEHRLTEARRLLDLCAGDRHCLDRALAAVRPTHAQFEEWYGYQAFVAAASDVLPFALYALQLAECQMILAPDQEQEGPADGAALCAAVLARSGDAAERARAHELRCILLLRRHRDAEGQAALEALRADFFPAQAETYAGCLAEIGNWLREQRPEHAVAVLGEAAEAGARGFALRRALLDKARIHWALGQHEAVVSTLQQLTALPELPDRGGDQVGEGRLLLADFTFRVLRDVPAALEMDQFMLDHAERFPAVRAQAYVQTTDHLYHAGDYERLYATVRRALGELPEQETRERMMVMQEVALYRLSADPRHLEALERLAQTAGEPAARHAAGMLVEVSR